MKLYIGICIVFCLQLITSNTNATENLSRNNTLAFAFDLLDETIKSMSNTNDNIVISPLSIQACLALAFIGARGKTAKELSNGLRLGTLEKLSVAKSFKDLLKSSDKKSLVTIANNIYLNNDIKIKNKFRRISRKYFDSNIKNVDFQKGTQTAKLINNWIKNKTQNKIEKLVEPNELKDVVALLINAIYFKGGWKHPFATTNVLMTFWLDDKNSVKVPLMEIENYYEYAVLKHLDAVAVRIPYNNSDISMLVIVPNEKTGLKQLEKNLKSINLADIEDRLYEEELTLSFPKFKNEFEINLNDILKKMNMKTMFSNNADFSLLTNTQIKVDKVYHKAIIEVDEYGTEGAAATLSASTTLMYTPSVVVDRPFLYFIKDKSAIYFMGRVSKF